MTYPTAVDAPHRIPVFHDDPSAWEEEEEPPPYPLDPGNGIDYEPDTWECVICTAPIGPRIVPDSENVYDTFVWTTCFKLTERARLQTHPDLPTTLRLCEDCVPYEASTP